MPFPNKEIETAFARSKLPSEGCFGCEEGYIRSFDRADRLIKEIEQRTDEYTYQLVLELLLAREIEDDFENCHYYVEGWKTGVRRWKRKNTVKT